MKKLTAIILSVLFVMSSAVSAFAAEPAQSPMIAETKFPTQDIVIADIVLTQAPYNADVTGVGDCTEIINRAIRDCYNNGGGTVWLPAGLYRVTGSINVLPFVTLRGDWADPDVYKSEDGTVIIADVPSCDDSKPALITLGGSSAAVGLTVWYPNQNIENPVPYPYTFYVSGCYENYMSQSIVDCTLINSYRGVGINVDSTKGLYEIHEMLTVKNLKATCLYEGIAAFNSADVDIFENVVISPKYWSKVGELVSAPQEADLAAFMRQNTTAMLLGDLEWAEFTNIHISDCNYAIRFAQGPRYRFAGSFYDLYIEDCNYGIYAPEHTIQECGDGWGISVAKSSISASEIAVKIEDDTHIVFADTDISGKIRALHKRVDNTVDLSDYTIDYTQSYQKPDANLKVVNADKTGLTDISETLQSVLDSFSGQSGVCYLPAGLYRLEKPVTVPEGVELRGSGCVSQRDEDDLSLGTMLVSYYGYGSEDDALITLGGDNAGVNCIRIVYALNDPQYGGSEGIYKKTSPAIESNADSVYVVNSCVILSSTGVELNGCNDFYLEKVIGCAYTNMFRLIDCSDGVVKHCHQNATYTARNGYDAYSVPELKNWFAEIDLFVCLFDPILRKETEYIYLEDSDGIQIYNTFIYGANSFLNSKNSSCVMINTGSDGQSKLNEMFNFEGGEAVSINAMRSNQDSNNGWKRSYSTDGEAVLRLYNRTTVNIKYLEPNFTENTPFNFVEFLKNIIGIVTTFFGDLVTEIDAKL